MIPMHTFSIKQLEVMAEGRGPRSRLAKAELEKRTAAAPAVEKAPAKKAAPKKTTKKAPAKKAAPKKASAKPEDTPE